jgi:quercetin dioxygenase-like cupin family protein
MCRCNPTIIEATMMKSELKLIPYAPVRSSVKLATRTQRGAFRLRYAAAVAIAYVFSGLAPAMLMALIWHETRLSPAVFAITFIIALTHAIGVGLPLFLICQLRGWINLVSCVVLGAFIGILPAAILAYPTQLPGFIAGVWTGALTGPDEVITAAILDGYIKPLIYFGLLGAWGGFVFWAVLKCWAIVDGGRQNAPDNTLKAPASTAPLPLCIARKVEKNDRGAPPKWPLARKRAGGPTWRTMRIVAALGLFAMLVTLSAAANAWTFKPGGQEISANEGILLPADHPRGFGATVTPLSLERTTHLDNPTISTFLVEYAPGASAMLHRVPSPGYVMVYVLSGTIRASAWQAGVGIYHTGETWVEPAFANCIATANASAQESARALVVLFTDGQHTNKQPTVGIC